LSDVRERDPEVLWEANTALAEDAAEMSVENSRLRGLLREWADLDGDASDILDLLTRTRSAIEQ
jgi:hypothetical protein